MTRAATSGTRKNEQSTGVTASQETAITVLCPQGTLATGGGYTIEHSQPQPDVPVVVDGSTSLLSTGGIGEGWSVSAKETKPTAVAPWGSLPG